MSVAQWFDQFYSNLLISTEVVNTISYRYKRITKQINKDYWNIDSDILNSLYVGSYGRDTEIHTSDIDVLLILPTDVYHRYNKYQNNGQSALLQDVKKSIENTYPSNMRADGQVIVISFTDNITFEVVPAFINSDNTTYTYPDTNYGGSWKVTKPRAEISAITIANQLYNYNLKKLCRMARAWKQKWDIPMGGLLIDTLAHNFLQNYEHRDKTSVYHDWMSRDFFAYLKEQNKEQQYWYAVGSNQLVYRKGPFEYKALRCYNIALEAIECDSKGYEYSAKQKWRDIYGTKFPA